MMLRWFRLIAVGTVLLVVHYPSFAQKGTAQIGEPGVAWYCRWDTALAEAKRSQRPILFMAAAAQCSGVPGVF